MSGLRDQLKPQAGAYAAEKGIVLLRFLGDGNDGAVWESTRNTAVKVLERPDSYQRERDAYFRLRDHNISEIEGFAVPALIDQHDSLKVVEMTMVFPPCVLDFAKSYVDRPPDYPPEAISDWEAETAKVFRDKWPTVQSILGWLRHYGVYYFDAKPDNIRFAERDD